MSREANESGGLESGTTMKTPIKNVEKGLGKPLPSGNGTPPWPKAPTEAMDRGHKFKNG